jgi:hypothetical protein
VITDAFLARVVDVETFGKFKEFQQNHEVMLSDDKKYCPNPKCQHMVEAKKDTKKLKCPKCKNDFCFKCGIAWHSGKSCEKAMKQMYEGWAYKIGAHRCPRCRVPVEKNAGCMHMSCTQC